MKKKKSNRQVPGVVQQLAPELAKDVQYSNPYGKRLVGGIDLSLMSPSYGVIGKDTASKASVAISHLKSKKEMLILHEIFSPPKSLRNSEEYGNW